MKIYHLNILGRGSRKLFITFHYFSISILPSLFILGHDRLGESWFLSAVRFPATPVHRRSEGPGLRPGQTRLGQQPKVQTPETGRGASRRPAGCWHSSLRGGRGGPVFWAVGVQWCRAKPAALRPGCPRSATKGTQHSAAREDRGPSGLSAGAGRGWSAATAAERS